jgi:hypothetical protein
MVANPFGIRTGGPSRLILAQNAPLRLTFGVLVHESAKTADPAAEYQVVRELLSEHNPVDTRILQK